jgi:cytochrome c-type biogenesis protein CcmH/NrfF
MGGVVISSRSSFRSKRSKPPSSSLIWGLWHAPLLLAGLNFAEVKTRHPRERQRNNSVFVNGSDGTRTRDLRRDRPAF